MEVVFAEFRMHFARIIGLTGTRFLRRYQMEFSGAMGKLGWLI